MKALRRARRTQSLLLSALILASVGGPRSRSSAQVTCGASSPTPARVQNVTDARALNTAVNCTDGGTVEAEWAGVVVLDAPISVGSGTFLYITGDDELAEVHGDSQTRMFEVSPSGLLSLTQLKLSGGNAESGGAIYSSMATVELESCVLGQNAATAGDGGAVWVQGGDLTIKSGEFSDNSASRYGGAVFAVDAGVVIQDNTVFESNRAVEGGGLYCGGAGDATVASCSLSQAMFTSNSAASEEEVSLSSLDSWADLYGGGAAAFYDADVTITDSEFQLNEAEVSGGAVFGGSGSVMAVVGCTFKNNSTPGYGAGVAASTATLGGDTLVKNNQADESGGGVFGWDSSGEVELDDVLCTGNIAEENGGCFYSAGRSIFNSGTSMVDNFADQGACIYVAGGSDAFVHGGEFTGCRCTGNGAFLFASDGANVTITGGSVTENVAERRAAAIYCSGDSFGMGGAHLTITGGTFSNNTALELGGAIAAWGPTTLVAITGGEFRNNTAKFYGGFIFIEEMASLTCEGATIEDHFAGDQGGAIYAQVATWVNSSCDLIRNEAPQGAAAYLTHTAEAVNLMNHDVTDNAASGGSVVYAAETSIISTAVTFRRGVDWQDDTSNRAVQLESGSSLIAKACVFGGWVGDTVIHNANPTAGSLLLDSCDFSESSATMVVSSPDSDAEIRNAVVGQATIENAAMLNDSLVLVDRALSCDTSDICGPGECVDSVLGVLCECLEEGVCLDDGGSLSIGLKTAPPTVTYSPDLVYFELMVSVAADGTTPIIWKLAFESEDLVLQVLPSSGVLTPGGNTTVAVTGSPLGQDVGGELANNFAVTSVGGNSTDTTTGVELQVKSAFYLCQAFEYAVPADDGTVTCNQCITVSGADGLDCEEPGATLASMPVREGYWRSGQESLEIHSCLYSNACGGATQIQDSDDYCSDGYKGPYCAVCTEGYGLGSSYACHSCTGAKSRMLIFAGSFFALMAILFLCIALVFLIGGLDAVDSVRRSMTRSLSIRKSLARGLSFSGKSRVSSQPLGESSARGLDATARTAAMDFVGGTRASASAAASRAGVVQDRGSTGPDAPINASRAGSFSGQASLLQAGTEASDAGEPGRSKCCGLGEKIKRWISLLPMDKLKILVVVWQILTVFPSITGVEFPPSYSRFLSWVGVVNLDVGHIFTASCVLPGVTFYHRLLLTTLTPLVLAIVLVLTYWMAKRRAGIGSTGVLAARAAWSRHMAAGLLLTFLVFTSTSTIAFETFACDDEAVEGESYLRADYRLTCYTTKHKWYMVYAGVMILVYPIGIPLLYACILWKNRMALNPRVRDTTDSTSGVSRLPMVRGFAANESAEELEERLEMRKRNPDLVPSMFLWKDFGPDMYYYEVIECGRRILLTGALIFIAPNTAAQAAVACMFAFASLLGFELLRPHLDPVDSWLYRLGCVVIFLSNFLALLIKADAAGESSRSFLGGVMVSINVLLILAVLFASCLTTQQEVGDHFDGNNAVTIAGTMLTFEQRTAANARSARAEMAVSTSPVQTRRAFIDGVDDFSQSGGLPASTGHGQELHTDHTASRMATPSPSVARVAQSLSTEERGRGSSFLARASSRRLPRARISPEAPEKTRENREVDL
ncbi:unnamed protein product [Scytosiphon promiscuus]